jgi:hypothetical protein
MRVLGLDGAFGHEPPGALDGLSRGSRRRALKDIMRPFRNRSNASLDRRRCLLLLCM